MCFSLVCIVQLYYNARCKGHTVHTFVPYLLLECAFNFAHV